MTAPSLGGMGAVSPSPPSAELPLLMGAIGDENLSLPQSASLTAPPCGARNYLLAFARIIPTAADITLSLLLPPAALGVMSLVRGSRARQRGRAGNARPYSIIRWKFRVNRFCGRGKPLPYGFDHGAAASATRRGEGRGLNFIITLPYYVGRGKPLHLAVPGIICSRSLA